MGLISTSLSTVEQVSRAKERGRKVLWGLLLCLGALLAGYQSAYIVAQYFELSMSEFETEVFDEDTFDVTLCTGSLFYRNKEFYFRLNEKMAILAKTENYSNECSGRTPKDFCTSLLEDEDRYSLMTSIPDQPADQYKGSFFIFTNLLFGNCLTITHGLGYDFTAISKMFSHMVVHETGTAPVFKRENVISLDNLQTQVFLTTKNVQVEGNVWPYINTCVDDKDVNFEAWKILVNPFNLTYKYSYESCLDQCLHRLTLTHCMCVRAISMKTQNSQKLPLCAQYCNKIPQHEMDSMCNCKPTCKNRILSARTANSAQNNDHHVVFSIIVHHTTSVYSLNELNPNKITNDSSRLVYTSEEDKNFVLGQGFSTVSRILKPNLTLESVLSAIGGIWGFWIGFSVTVLFGIGFELPKRIRPNFFKSKKNGVNYPRIFGRVFYAGTLFFLSALSSYQIYLTITEFLQHKVIQITTTEAQDSSSFPMPIVCSSSFIYFHETSLENNSDLSKKIDSLKQMHVPIYGKQELYRVNSLGRESMFYTYQLTNDEKEQLLPKVSDFISSCTFKTEGGQMLNCTNDLVSVEIPTASSVRNPIRCGHLNFTSNLTARIQELELKLKFPMNDIFIDGVPLVNHVVFHPFSFLSFIYPTDTLLRELSWGGAQVLPGDLVDIKYSVMERIQLPFPFSDCVEDPSEVNWPEWAQAWSSEFNLTYNYEDCLKICFVQQVFDFKFFKNISAIDLKRCECKSPCRSVSLDFDISQQQYKYKTSIYQRQYANMSELFNYLSEGSAVVRIQGGSLTKKVITDKPSIEPDSLIGIIGGILGLWVGVSILTLVVEVQSVGLKAFLTICKTLKALLKRV